MGWRTMTKMFNEEQKLLTVTKKEVWRTMIVHVLNKQGKEEKEEEE